METYKKRLKNFNKEVLEEARKRKEKRNNIIIKGRGARDSFRKEIHWKQW